jgi:hypothetical protein
MMKTCAFLVLASLATVAMATNEVCEDFAMDFSQYERGTYITDNFVSPSMVVC